MVQVAVSHALVQVQVRVPQDTLLSTLDVQIVHCQAVVVLQTGLLYEAQEAEFGVHAQVQEYILFEDVTVLAVHQAHRFAVGVAETTVPLADPQTQFIGQA